MQIEDPRWRSYAPLQHSLRRRTRLDDETGALERALDALLDSAPREGESHQDMTVRIRESTKRRERRRRVIGTTRDAIARDDDRVRSVQDPEASAHARLDLQTILAGASAIERGLVFDLAVGEAPNGAAAATARKRLQRFRARLCV